jgi:hypothetical protein
MFDMKKIVLLAAFTFWSIIARAEVFYDMQFGSALTNLRSQFPNAKFEEVKVAWTSPDERLYRMEGDGLSGSIYIILDNFDRFGREEIEKLENDLASTTDEDRIFEINKDIARVKLRLVRRIEERLILKVVRWAPRSPLLISTLERKYGKPNKIFQSDINLKSILLWKRGIQAELSDDEKHVTLIEYFPALKP